MSDDATPATTPAQTPADTPVTTGTAPPADPLIKGPDQKPGEIGGPKGPEPTRYGDWESNGRCSDF